ncbi:hypothetical protein GCM10009789_25900 [Kribbella sancticallisti]|uniref:AAA ATPase domain-containing protein n=1 Tax=Kribbella sancticallisti TaxID=460087 RepID=A0ABP4P3Z4_9ACTN
MAQLHDLSSAKFEGILDSIRSTGPAKSGGRVQELREFVALLSAFDVASLPGSTDRPHVDPVIDQFLAQDCEPVVTRAGEKWSLRADVRKETLAVLDRDGRLTDFEGGTDLNDVGFVMARRYINKSAQSLKNQSLEELQGTATASEWLSGTKVQIPTPEEARGERTIENLLRPLRMLVADGFVGRKAELQQLSDYAEVLPASSRTTSTRRRVRRAMRRNERPPLLIYGPGGVGKSTLLARFILDHVDAGTAHHFPFAYLSFDRQELRIDQPLTLLADAAGQLAALFPKVAAEAVALSQAVRTTIAAADVSRLAPRASKSEVTVRTEDTIADEEVLLARYAGIVETAVGKRDHPHLWVLDTFEVAQRQSPEAVDTLWGFLDRFQDHSPRLRVVMCGRVPMDRHETVDLHLTGLDRESAMQLLRRSLAGFELPEEFLSSVERAVSTQPLSLRLAADYLRDRLKDGMSSKEAQQQFLFSMNEVSLPYLYRRVVAHIDDADVRRLVNGCMVVRRITPDVIRHVLARPSGLSDMTDSRARELFERLAREVALVQRLSPHELVARPDLRKVVLPLVLASSPRVVERIQRAAYRYFAKQNSFAAKVEELYYRLCLGQATATLDRAFNQRAVEELAGIVEELPTSSQVYLSARLGLTVQPELLAAADDLTWARQASLTARRLLDAGKAEDALTVLTERRTDVSLPFTAAIEVEALASLHRFAEALTGADWWAGVAADRHDTDTYIDIRLLTARIAEDTGDVDQALRWLREIDGLVRLPEQLPERLAARVAIVRIHRKAGTSESEEATRMRESLIRDADTLFARDRSRDPSLVRDLAAEIGDAVPSLARDALRLGGYKEVTGGPDKGKPRKRPPTKSSLTQSERGQELTESLDEELADEVTETFRAEADASPFA